MPGPLIRKLKAFADLDAGDEAALHRICKPARYLVEGTDLIEEGDRPEDVFLLLKGWACRYKILPDGGRQIVAFLIPGDLCDVNIFILNAMDHSIGLLSDAEVVAIPKRTLLAIIEERPRIAKALLWATLVDEATLREWIVNVGQRDAIASVAHLLCEMWLRLSQVGLADGNSFSMPLTQEQLGDTVGITPVHVNRTMQRLRQLGLIARGLRSLEVTDVAGLKQVAGFNPNYLHLTRRTNNGRAANA